MISVSVEVKLIPINDPSFRHIPIQVKSRQLEHCRKELEENHV